MIPAQGAGPSLASDQRVVHPGAVGRWAETACLLGTIVSVAICTLNFPGSTRMYAWPWSLALVIALASPACAVAIRAFSLGQPLVLPGRGWTGLAAGTIAVTVGSALASPYRPQVLQWAAPWVSAVAVFIAVYDWTQSHPDRSVARQETIRRWCYGFLATVAVVSLSEWGVSALGSSASRVFDARNPYPLGHSNYTAGIALLMLPGCVATARRKSNRRWLGVAGAALGLALLFTSGSRAGAIAVGGLLLLGVGFSPLRRRSKIALGIGAVAAALLFVIANPRTRQLLTRPDPSAPPNLSNVQRDAMLTIGLRMGADRPWLGWGPGATPLVYPRYRSRVDGGAEDVLELHSLPVQIWAELGLAGIVCALFAVALGLRQARLQPIAALTLAGYAIFAVFDFQLDVPAIGFALATLAALLAETPSRSPRVGGARAFGGLVVASFATIVALGHHDETPLLNTAALRDEVWQTHPDRAIALLRQSLAANPDQEIAHFNLGWLLVVAAPQQAADHFRAAARLAPDRGGVYLGLALARLNAGDSAEAIRASALEMLNDPTFQLSPWWRNSRLAPLYAPTMAELRRFEDRLAAAIPTGTWTARELAYTRVLHEWIDGKATAAAAAAASDTDARRTYFGRSPDRAAARRAPSRTLRYERPGYPVLVRNLNIPPPVDLWLAEESTIRGTPLGFLWPEKGWVPSTLMIGLLGGRQLPKN